MPLHQLLLLLPLLQLPRPSGATAPCTWNTSAEAALGLPGCCGWNQDGCGLGCCMHNWTGVVPAPSPARSGLIRFLSFYDDCRSISPAPPPQQLAVGHRLVLVPAALPSAAAAP